MRRIALHDFDFPVLPSYHREETRSENGFVTFQNVEDVGTLPPAENYDIGNLIKAGVPLQETRTNILSVGDSELLEHLENDTLTKPEGKPNE
jgi:hypothetical protein